MHKCFLQILKFCKVVIKSKKILEKNMKKIISLLVLIVNLFASFSSNDDYLVYKSKNYFITYTKDYEKEAAFIKENIENFLNIDAKLFSYKLDEPLRIILISKNHEVTNAFSTQSPFNIAAFYTAGAYMVDYFSSKSWLKTLLLHEIAHNYQLNAKNNEISKKLHKYLGNNAAPLFAVVPFFTYPNIMLPTFMLEGNAVLNESIYGNGGRLLSGRFEALKNQLILDGKFTPTTLINHTTTFPYLEEQYILGGFYMQYLAKKYSLKKVNSFFYEHSKRPILPMLIDTSFTQYFGVDMVTSINDFIKETKQSAKDFKKANTSIILAKSKREIFLNKQNNKILFISSDLKTPADLNIYDINKKMLKKISDSWINGKVFQIDNKYYSNGNFLTAVQEQKIGLFNKNRVLKKGTKSKFIQDIKNNNILYIDTSNSFLRNKLYLNDRYYDDVNSTALFDDEENIYYFKQNKDKRELYKNKRLLFSFKGYYSKLADIKDGKIYFVSSSKLGSSLFVYNQGKISKVLDAHNIIDAKIISQNEAIVTVLQSDNYLALKLKLQNEDCGVYKRTLALNKNIDFHFKKSNSKIKGAEYNSLKELDYSNTNLSLSSDNLLLQSNFTDTLSYNILSFGGFKDEDLSSFFASYINQRYSFPFALQVYSTNRKEKTDQDRGYGVVFQVQKNLLKRGLNTINSDFIYYLDDEIETKDPKIVSLSYEFSEQYPLASWAYNSSNLSLSLKEDRKDKTGSLAYTFTHYLFSQSYMRVKARHIKSDANLVFKEERGIKIYDSIDFTRDKTNTYIEGNDFSFYATQVNSLHFTLKKDMNFSQYFFFFPVSLQKESIFYTFNHYDIETYIPLKIKEHIVGLDMDILFFHNFTLPLTLKVIKNDFSEDDYKFKFGTTIDF